MAKGTTKRAAAKSTAKSSTVKVGNTKVVGANEADKQNIALAKESVRAEETRTTTGSDTPDAKKTTAAARTAAKKQFAEADAKVSDQEIRAARAARPW